MFSRTGIYIGWVVHQNLGDEAMWNVCRQRFGRINWSLFDQISYEFTPGKFLRRTRLDYQYLIRCLSEETMHQRRVRLMARQSIHCLSSSICGGVGIMGGGTLINDAETCWSISCSRQHTIIMMQYRPKCLDFTMSLGWERFTIRTSELTKENCWVWCWT